MAAQLLRCHHRHEFLVVDLTVAINVRFPDHLVYLLVGQLLAQIGHNVSQLCGGDEAISVFVEYSKGLSDLFLAIRVLHLSCHHGEELWKVDCTITVGVDLIDHVLELRLSGILSQRAHHSAQLFGGDRTIAILVKK